MAEEEQILISGLVCLAILGAIAVFVSICVARWRRRDTTEKHSRAPFSLITGTEYPNKPYRHVVSVPEQIQFNNIPEVHALGRTRFKTVQSYPNRKPHSTATIKLNPIKASPIDNRALISQNNVLQKTASRVHAQYAQKPYTVSFPDENRKRTYEYVYSDHPNNDHIVDPDIYRPYRHSTAFVNNKQLIPYTDETRVADEMNFVTYQYPMVEFEPFPLMLSKPEIYEIDEPQGNDLFMLDSAHIVHPSSDLQIVEAIDMPFYYYDQYFDTRYTYSTDSSGSTSSVSSSSTSSMSSEDYYYQYRRKRSIKTTRNTTQDVSPRLHKTDKKSIDSGKRQSNLNKTVLVSRNDKTPFSVSNTDIEPMNVEFGETEPPKAAASPIPSITVEDMSNYGQLEVSIASLPLQNEKQEHLENIAGKSISESVQTEEDTLPPLQETRIQVERYIQTEEATSDQNVKKEPLAVELLENRFTSSLVQTDDDMIYLLNEDDRQRPVEYKASISTSRYVQTLEAVPSVQNDKKKSISVQTIENKFVQTENNNPSISMKELQMTSTDNINSRLTTTYVQTDEYQRPVKNIEEIIAPKANIRYESKDNSFITELVEEPLPINDSGDRIMSFWQTNKRVPSNEQHVQKSQTHQILNQNEYQFYFGRARNTQSTANYKDKLKYISNNNDTVLQPTKLYDVNLHSNTNNDIKVRLYRTPSFGEQRQSNDKYEVGTDHLTDSRTFDRNRMSQLVSKAVQPYITKGGNIQAGRQRRLSNESLTLEIPKHYLQHERFSMPTQSHVGRTYMPSVAQKQKYEKYGTRKENEDHFDSIWKQNRFLWYKDIRTQRQPDRLTGVISHLGSYRPDADTLKHRNYRLHPQLLEIQTKT